jgi:hypothetical protein
MSKGVRTSEFWLTALAMVYLLALQTGVIPHASEVDNVVQGVAALLVALGYTGWRTFLKAKTGDAVELGGVALEAWPSGEGATLTVAPIPEAKLAVDVGEGLEPEVTLNGKNVKDLQFPKDFLPLLARLRIKL